MNSIVYVFFSTDIRMYQSIPQFVDQEFLIAEQTNIQFQCSQQLELSDLALLANKCTFRHREHRASRK